jgi:hypothetical protein
MNFLWLQTAVGRRLQHVLPYPAAVYLLGGSGLSLLTLAWAIYKDRLTRSDVGLGPSGWTALRRLIGLAVLTMATFGQCVLLKSQVSNNTAQPATASPATAANASGAILGTAGSHAKPSLVAIWGDFCLWFLVLFPASIAELLVFMGAGFCLLRRGLEQSGLGPIAAWGGAAAFGSVTFGLFHFTHSEEFHSYVVPLMGEMFSVIVFFWLTRNIYMALGLHNSFAAVGFLREAYVKEPFIDPSTLNLPLMIAASIVPFLLLHCLEWQRRPLITKSGRAVD